MAGSRPKKDIPKPRQKKTSKNDQSDGDNSVGNMTKSNRKSVNERYEALEKLIFEGSSALEPVLTKALSDRSPRIRWLAALTIGEKQFKNMLPSLLGVIDNSDSLTRFYAIEGIRKLSPKKEVALALLNCLLYKDELVRVAAAQALGELRNKNVFAELENSLSDSSPLVRAYTAEALGKIGGKKGLQILKKYVDKESEDRARAGFYLALYSLGESVYLNRLTKLIESDDLLTRCAVANASQSFNLGKLDRARIISLLKKQLDKEVTVFVRDCFQEALQTLKGTSK